MTGHGFRSSAATILNECGLWNPDAVEKQMAHEEKNAVRKAYVRGDYWDERVRMMGWWSAKLDEMRRGGEVIQLRA
jgi:integrase